MSSQIVLNQFSNGDTANVRILGIFYAYISSYKSDGGVELTLRDSLATMTNPEIKPFIVACVDANRYNTSGSTREDILKWATIKWLLTDLDGWHWISQSNIVTFLYNKSITNGYEPQILTVKDQEALQIKSHEDLAV